MQKLIHVHFNLRYIHIEIQVKYYQVGNNPLIRDSKMIHSIDCIQSMNKNRDPLLK